MKEFGLLDEIILSHAFRIYDFSDTFPGPMKFGVSFLRILFQVGALLSLHQGLQAAPSQQAAGSLVELFVDGVFPTQPSLGFRERDRKEAEIREIMQDAEAFNRYLIERAPPVVRGPLGRYYILDRHHEFGALLKLGVRVAYGHIKHDYSHLSEKEFARKMTDKGYAYLRDINGRRIAFRDLPRRILEMADDPYRSLAGELRRAGGYLKTSILFAEFRWANWLRKLIPLDIVTKDPVFALRLALRYAGGPKAAELPGAAVGFRPSCSKIHYALPSLRI